MKLLPCVGCSAAKGFSAPEKKTTHKRSDKIHGRVFVDSTGKKAVISIGGKQYGIIFRDGATRMSREYFMKHKSDAPDALEQYMANTNAAGPPKIIRSDDVATFSGMSVKAAETSFHLFCEKFSAALWDKWVYLPVGDELKEVERVFRMSGYPGAMGSTDCTHFKWSGGPFSEARMNTGKEGYASVVVETTCDHTGV